MIFFWGFIVLLSMLYLFLVCFIISGWIRTKTHIMHNGIIQPAVSVIIPVRNESAGFNLLLSDMADQNYPLDKFEVIIVDDHSTCPPDSLISDFKKKINIRKFNLGDNEKGKKAALLKGLSASGSELVLTTDADCRVTADWISEMSDYFVSRKVKLVFGSVLFAKSRKLHGSFQGLEYLSLVAAGAGFAGNGHPILCSAANMGFERIKYLEFIEESKSSLAVSGDDVLFMLWLKKKYPGQTGFIKSLNSIVVTKPAASLKEFINQRLRWTSKSRYYKDIVIILVALLVYSGALALSVLLIGAFFSGLLLKGFIFLFLVRCIIDFVLLFIVTGYYRNRYLLIIFLPLEIVYFIYISLTGLIGNFLSFVWKERRIKP